jgi:hypothetical protein
LKIAPYWKTVVAVVGAVALTAANVVSDDTVTPAEWVEIGLAFLAAVGVYGAKNAPPSR